MAKGKKAQATKSEDNKKHESEHEETEPEVSEHEETHDEETPVDVASLIKDFTEHLKSHEKEVKDWKKKLAQLQKLHTKELKSKKKKRNTEKKDKQPAGFNKAKPIPEKLMDFFMKNSIVYYVKDKATKKDVEHKASISKGEELPRTLITRYLYGYIKKNNLKDDSDKRIIKPDKQLRDLFNLDETATINFNNFQSLLGKLYDAEKAANAASAAPEEKKATAEPVEAKKPKSKAK